MWKYHIVCNLEKGKSEIIPAYIDKTGTLSPKLSSIASQEEFTKLQKYINKTIKQISNEIFNGNFSENNQLQTASADEINAKIGTVVIGYSAENLEWQVYYADEIETFLISRNIAFEIDEEVSSSLTGSSVVRNSIYGAKWNSKWLEKCSTESTRRNAKATEYLCDSANWNSYATGSASYAAGGPTLELLIASWNTSQKTNITLSSNSITNAGYTNPGFMIGAEDVKSRSNGVYLFDGNYLIASPNNEEDEEFGVDAGDCLIGITGTMYNCDVSESWGVRPIVSIPTAKISINGNTVTVLQ